MSDKPRLQHEWAYERPRELETGMGKHVCIVRNVSSRTFEWQVRCGKTTVAQGWCSKGRHAAMLCAEAVLNVVEAKLWNGGKL